MNPSLVLRSPTLSPSPSPLLASDRRHGMLLGVAIGDALGLPIECWTKERILAEIGPVTGYLEPALNKYVRADYLPGELPRGVVSDDTNLTLAVARAVLGSGLDLDAIANEHVREAARSVFGWGWATRNATLRIAEGVPWREAAEHGKGEGCGPAMKLSPVVAELVRLGRPVADSLPFIADFTAMTHKTNVAVCGAFAFAAALEYCLTTEPDRFDEPRFVRAVRTAADRGASWFPSLPTEQLLVARLELLERRHQLTIDDMLRETDGARSPMASCLPFGLYGFLRAPRSSEGIFEIVAAGGDADSTGAMAGALVGALNGPDIFPRRLLEGLAERGRIDPQITRFASAA